MYFSHLHSVLPANGAPVSRQRTSRVKEMYTDYVREQTLQHWKFWIVSRRNCVSKSDENHILSLFVFL